MKKASTECGRVGWVEASESAVIRAAVAYDARRVWDRRPARHAQPNPVCQSSRGMDPLPPTPTAAPAPGSAAVFPLRRDPGRDGTVGPRQGPQALPLASDSSGPTATTT